MRESAYPEPGVRDQMDQGLVTPPLPVVESGTRGEEPVDVHTDCYPPSSSEPSPPNQGWPHYTEDHKHGDETSHHAGPTRGEFDSYSEDGNPGEVVQTQFAREELSHYRRNSMPDPSGHMYVPSDPRVNCPHQIQPKYSAKGLAKHSCKDQTEHADVFEPRYDSSMNSGGITNHKNTHDPRDSPGLPSLSLRRYDGKVSGQYGNDILPYMREGAEIAQYHIPRPSLKCADSECSCSRSKSPHSSSKTWPMERTSMASSNSSTQSGSSGSLLLTAANLAALRCEPGRADILPEDSVSLASSTHFTVVNGVDRRKAKPLPTCCWHTHQLTALVLAMSAIFLVFILAAVLYVEMRWRDIRMFR